MTLLSPLTRKLVAASLFVCLAALFWSALLTPLWRWAIASSEALKEVRFSVMRANRVLDESRNVSSDTLVELEQAVRARLIAGDNEASAVNQLQFLADSLLKEQGLALESIQAANTTPSGSLTRLSIEIKANGTEPEVVRYLAAIEKAAPLIRVDRLVLRGLDMPMADGTTTAKVSLEATLSAYWHPMVVANASRAP